MPFSQGNFGEIATFLQIHMLVFHWIVAHFKYVLPFKTFSLLCSGGVLGVYNLVHWNALFISFQMRTMLVL